MSPHEGYLEKLLRILLLLKMNSNMTLCFDTVLLNVDYERLTMIPMILRSLI